MGRKRYKLEGRRFGKLTVKSLAYRVSRRNGTVLYYNCICDCGTETVVMGQHLLSGNTRSCGCARRDWERKRTRTDYRITVHTVIDPEIDPQEMLDFFNNLNPDFFKITETKMSARNER